MRRIKKIRISKNIERELHEKQARINSGEQAPDWSLTREQRHEIKEKLLLSQKNICCYCECAIDFSNVHIEHYFERHDRQELIYNYQDNMILSCEGDREPKHKPETSEEKEERVQNISCGHKKSKSYNNGKELEYNRLLNPMLVDENWITFYNGFIEANTNCSKEQTDIVKYSIARLDLDCNRLNNLRLNTITQINQQLNFLSEEEQKTFITELLDESQESLPAFYSTIKSNFEFILLENSL